MTELEALLQQVDCYTPQVASTSDWERRMEQRESNWSSFRQTVKTRALASYSLPHNAVSNNTIGYYSNYLLYRHVLAAQLIIQLLDAYALVVDFIALSVIVAFILNPFYMTEIYGLEIFLNPYHQI